MKSHYKIGIALIAGATIGGVAVQALHAQAKPPVIVIVDISAVTDPDGFKAVTQRPTASTATVMQGGHYISRSSKITAIDGTAPSRYVIISFDSAEKANAWYNSPEQKKINEIRMKTTKSRVFMVDGM